MSISTLKWPELLTIGAVFHSFEVTWVDGLVAGDGDEDVADLRGFVHGHHPEAVDGTASRALVGLISVTITSAPCPLARMATPRPHQP